VKKTTGKVLFRDLGLNRHELVIANCARGKMGDGPNQSINLQTHFATSRRKFKKD
jgi:hypothetical protein